MNSPTQLIFPFQADQRATFSSFFCTPDNINLLNRVQDIVPDNNHCELLIDGISGSGKSFLMQSICNELSAVNKQLAFVPMSKVLNMGVEIMQNLASLDAVCIDDMQLILSKPEWEEAIFHLINECEGSNCTLIFSMYSNQSLESLVELPDLLSRLKRMEHMTLQPVDDANLHAGLLFVSQHLDINLEKAELEFLLQHHAREFSELVKKIILLDQRAGELKRKITIPLIKETFST